MGIKNYKQYKLSSELEYALNQGILDSFRYGSDKFFDIIREAKAIKDELELSEEELDILSTDIGDKGMYEGQEVYLDTPMELEQLNEAKYKDREVELNKPRRGGSKKYVVYVKVPKTGRVKKIEFGDTTGLKAKVSDPEARKSFAARHKCAQKKDKTKAGYWACRLTKYGHLWNGQTYPGYW